MIVTPADAGRALPANREAIMSRLAGSLDRAFDTHERRQIFPVIPLLERLAGDL